MKKHQIVLVLVIMFGILNLATGQCPKDETAALAEDSTWGCRKECTDDAECAGASKSCNCDGNCGMSCFNPDAECPAITVVDGNIDLSNGLKYGSKATVTCNSGYVLTGQRVRNCRSDKTWSHSNNVPNCTQGCPSPSSDLGNAFPASGTDYYAVGYPVGHVVTYTCRTGYSGAGNGDRTCLNSFTWSNLQMACTIQSCGSPETVNHASHSGTNYNFGGRITYSCDKGYNIDGTARFSCRITDDVAEWYPEGSWPTCDPVRCIAPQSPDNGGYTGAYTQEYGDGVDYKCDPGYKLNGPGKGLCNENGTWGDVPTCDASIDATFNLVELDGYTVVSGSWTRTRVNDYRGLIGYSLEGDGTVRSVPYPLTGGEMVCVQAYIKNTQANELKAQAYQGGETKDLHTFSASDDWKLEKFWFTPVKSTDTLVQLQFFATVASNVLLDEIKEVNDSECDVVPDATTTTSEPSTDAETQPGPTTTSTSGPTSTSGSPAQSPPRVAPLHLLLSCYFWWLLGSLLL